MIAHSDRQILQALDNNQYRDADLIVIKAPLYVPYLLGRGNYERVDGEIEIGGISYNYVARKVMGDTLYLKCLPNYSRTQLNAARDKYKKIANDLPTDKSGKQASKKMNKPGEYPQPAPLMDEYRSVAVRLHHSPAGMASKLISSFIKKYYQPPDLTC